jgi:hypothetical protein
LQRARPLKIWERRLLYAEVVERRRSPGADQTDFNENSMMRWKASATAALTLISATGTMSRAQTTTFMTANPNWTSLTGCHVAPGGLLVLPGGVVYYTQYGYPASGTALLGICGQYSDDVPPPTIGYGTQTIFPSFGTGGGGNGGGPLDQLVSQNDQAGNDQGDNQGGNEQGNDDQGPGDQPHYTPTNDGPPNGGTPNTSEIPQNDVPPLDTTTTPEPGSVILLGSGLAALAAREVRRRNRSQRL